MKKSIIFKSLILGSFLIPSCSNRLDVTPPNAIYDEQIQGLLAQGGEKAQEIIGMFASPMPMYLDYWNIAIGSGGANATTNSYQGIQWMRGLEGNDIAFGTSTTTWDGDYYGKNAYLLEKISRLPAIAQNGAHWYGYAYSLKQANLLLSYTEFLDKSSALYKESTAKGLLVRAYSYMCLMEEYAPAYCNMIDENAENSGMSLYTVASAAQEAIKRSTAKETYEFILKDINTAVEYLTSYGYTHDDDKLEDIDLGVANFLKARLGLFIGDKTVLGKKGWEICKEACDAIINNGGYGFIATNNWGATATGDWAKPEELAFYPETNAFLCVRKAVNPEVILGYTNGSTNTDIGKFQSSLANIYSAYSKKKAMARIDDRLYAKIADNDCRKGAFRKEAIGTIKYSDDTPGEMPSYCNIKFAFNYGLDVNGTTHTTRDNNNTEFCKFRLSEVYLMAAEAELALNGPGAAAQRLNTLLEKRATSGTLSCANYGGQDFTGKMAEFIKLQWSIEMWGESGREYFNNKRWKVDINRAGSAVHADAKGTSGEWSKWQEMTLEFPENEQLYNPHYAADAVNTPSALK